jgi:hypothetical protein
MLLEFLNPDFEFSLAPTATNKSINKYVCEKVQVFEKESNK